MRHAVLTRLAAAFALAALAACASTPSSPPAPPAPADAGLRLGLGTPTGAEDAARDADLLGAALGKSLGRPVTTRVFAGYDGLVDALGKGEVDVAWIPPLGYVRAAELAAVTPIRKARRGGKSSYRAVIFVKADRKWSKPEDLAGKSIAWVSESSTSGHLFPKALLLEKGLDPAKHFGAQSFLGDHTAVCQAVLDGKVDAGASFSDDVGEPDLAELTTCYALLADSRPKLRVVAASEPIPNDVLVARAGLDPATTDAVGKALDALAAGGESGELFGRLFDTDGFEPANPGDYDAVKRARALLDAKR